MSIDWEFVGAIVFLVGLATLINRHYARALMWPNN